MVAVAAFSFDRRLSDLYWYLFVGVWLLALAYLLVFVLALLLPFHLLAVELGDSRIPKIVHPVNIVLIISIVAFWTVTRLKRRKGEQCAAPEWRPRHAAWQFGTHGGAAIGELNRSAAFSRS